MITNRHDYDVIVIGSGPAGQNAALEAASRDAHVLVIEREAAVGGACVQYGTIPSKTLRETALSLTTFQRRSGDVYRISHDAQLSVSAGSHSEPRVSVSFVDTNAPMPPHLPDMLRAAEKLSDGFRFVRVDLYDTPKGPLFGEMTFAPEAGLCRFEPADFDLELGESWAYPEQTNELAQLRSFANAFNLRGEG